MHKEEKIMQKTMFMALMIVVVLGAVPSLTFAMGQGRNMIDEDGDGIPIGMEDEDGDGIMNKDDDDFERPMKNMRDADGDGVANRDDEDYERPMDGLNRPETSGQINSNKPEGVGNRQMIQNTSPVQQRMNAPEQITPEKIEQSTKTQQKLRSGEIGDGKMREQLRTMTQTKEQLQQSIADDVVQLQNQGGLNKLFMGVDGDVVEHAQSQLDNYEQKIEALKTMSADATSAEDKAVIDAQIVQMELMHAQMETLLAENAESFSLFGWAKNLLN